MQSIFRLPWCSDHLAPKLSEKPMMDTPLPSTMIEIPAFNSLKRKRTVMPEVQLPSQSDFKKHRSGNTAPERPAATVDHTPSRRETDTLSPSIPNGMNTDLDESTVRHSQAQRENLAHTCTASERRTKLQQAIENQLNLQILVKHNELRLIDQELAKCQVALEQLRRCELRPYPGLNGPEMSISAGIGASIMPPQGYSKPPHAAAHGVADGPYSRHYRQWLLQDPDFDPQPFCASSPVDYALASANRPIRTTGLSRKSVARSFTTPAKYIEHLQSLPSQSMPPPKKDKSAPLVLRRSTDSKMVKLVCNNCNRGDMSSIQGFLNHCRIAHKVVYESHDAAAIDCGRILDEQEIANLPADTQTLPLPKSTPKPTPVRTTPSTLTSSFGSTTVHPLNTPSAARLPTNTAQHKELSSRKPAPALLSSTLPKASCASFKPSPALPKLSALLAKSNWNGDLEQAVANATKRPDVEFDDFVISPDAATTPNSPANVTPSVQAGKRGVFAPPNVARPLSRKGYRQPVSQGPRASSLIPAPSKSDDRDMSASPQEASANNSPHTADGNPGLVSDVEDDDNGSASEEETAAPHQPLSHPLCVTRDCTENMDMAVAVGDDMDDHGVVIRRNSMLNAEDRSLRVVGGPSRKLGGGKRV